MSSGMRSKFCAFAQIIGYFGNFSRNHLAIMRARALPADTLCFFCDLIRSNRLVSKESTFRASSSRSSGVGSHRRERSRSSILTKKYTYTFSVDRICILVCVNDGQIAELLRLRNPWWRDGARWSRSDELLRHAATSPFSYRPEPLRAIDADGLYTLTGPRRVGKSLEVKRKIEELLESKKEPRSIVFCSCDGFSEQDLRRVFRVGRNVVQAGEGPLCWFLDEITAVRGDWSAIVKEARDNTELARDCVVLTGSSARGMRSASKNLAGRRGRATHPDRLLMPVGFRVFCEMRGGFDAMPEFDPTAPSELGSREAKAVFDDLAFWTEQLVDSWHHFLRVGGFPEAVRESIATGDASAFAADLWAVIEGEAFTSGGLTSAEVNGLIGCLAESLTTPINASRIARDVGLAGHQAVYERLRGLQLAYLVWTCHQESNMRPNLRAGRKVYFTDSLLARAIHLRNPVFPEPDPSKVVEQQIGLSLVVPLTRSLDDGLGPSETVMYRRTESRSEIDFVSPFAEMPIEVKYSDTGWKRAAQTLRANFGKGIVATRRTHDTSGDVWAIPAANLAWALDAGGPRSG